MIERYFLMMKRGPGVVVLKMVHDGADSAKRLYSNFDPEKGMTIKIQCKQYVRKTLGAVSKKV